MSEFFRGVKLAIGGLAGWLQAGLPCLVCYSFNEHPLLASVF